MNSTWLFLLVFAIGISSLAAAHRLGQINEKMDLIITELANGN